jgi:DNA repair protein RecN (Recombination protein N)
MFLQISIQNYIFIENANLDFHNGLNIMTGETGAGKSIFLGALNITLGGKVSADLIKPGNDILRVTTTFDVNGNAAVLQLLGELGIEADEGILFLRREVTAEGKSRCFINDRVSNVSNLKKLGVLLLDIHSQRENQIIYQQAKHQFLYDTFLYLTDEMQQYSQAYAHFIRTDNELKDLYHQEKKLTVEKDYIEFTIKELKGNLLSEDEYDTLKTNLKKVSNSEKLDKTLSAAHKVLGDQVSPKLYEVCETMKKAVTLDDSLSGLFKRIETVSTELDDLKESLMSNMSSQAIDPVYIDELNTKLQKTERLRKKYGLTFEDLSKKLIDSENKLKSLENITFEKQKLLKQRKEAGLAAYRLSEEIEKKRKEGISVFEKAMQKELHYLNMQGAKMSVALSPVPSTQGLQIPDKKSYINEAGLSNASFVFSPAPESDFKPLRDIASGGEASRIMLALKKVLLEGLTYQTLVLDEIDTGIGGKTALHVGDKIKEMSGVRQMFVITHLPQIAKHGDSHFRVIKTEQKKITTTRIYKLSDEEKVQEISRMIAGDEKNKKDLTFAKEFISR